MYIHIYILYNIYIIYIYTKLYKRLCTTCLCAHHSICQTLITHWKHSPSGTIHLDGCICCWFYQESNVLTQEHLRFFENLLKYSGGLWVVESCTIWVWVKIRYPNNWMVNTKLDISICGPLGLPFWPTSICWWFSSISPAWSRCSWRPWFYQVHQWESTRCWSGLTVPSSMLWWTRMDTYRHVGPPCDS
jgi:hypothetical protein